MRCCRFITAGWGTTETQQDAKTLLWTTVPGLSRQQALASGLVSNLEKDHIAAGLGSDGHDSCEGDSGGPLFIPGPEFPNSTVSQDIQVGIVGYGPSGKCGSENLGLYTSVGYWYTWIQDTMSYENMGGVAPPSRKSTGVKYSTCITGRPVGGAAQVTKTGGLCCEACRSNTACTAWSWSTSTNLCSLKGSGWKAASGACVSGQMKGTSSYGK